MKIGKTIVGGRSSYDGYPVECPRGIEILLKKAKVDQQFRQLLLRTPEESAISIGLNLTASEQLILANTNRAIMEKMIDFIDVPKHHVNTFMGSKAAAMLAIVIATSFVQPPFAWSGGAREENSVSPIAVAQLYAQLDLQSVQEALLSYAIENNGSFPSTLQWLLDGPLESFVKTDVPYYEWHLQYRYMGISRTDMSAENYALIRNDGPLTAFESGNGIGPPIETEKHAFWHPNPVAIIFPKDNDNIFIKGQTVEKIVMNASHENNDAALEWYLDGERIADTRGIHAIPLPGKITMGKHYLFVIDADDNYSGVVFGVKRADK
ncbi:MAG: hypothetical protein HN368_03455 [Spirochaetales bacterium]|jgi:membrane carboxypeptidase/penicillin-binding protein PbpC|nr:hypothetical protein [Spirochaetales bacterium]